MRAVILVLLVLILPAMTLRAQPRMPPIAWLSDRDGDYDVYVWDGDQTINVSNNDTIDSYLQPSPDGRFAWLSVVGDYSEVYVWDGEQTINVGNSPSYDYLPVWSNDGQLAWYTDQSDERGFSLQVAVWEGEQTMLLGREFGSTGSRVWNSAYGGLDMPVWSDDGRLAWSATDEQGVTSLYVWDAAQVTRVTNIRSMDTPNLFWLPNGDLIWTILSPRLDLRENTSFWLWDGEQIFNLAQPSENGIWVTLWGEGQLAFTAGTWDESQLYIWTGTGAVPISTIQNGRLMYLSGSDQGQLAWIAERNSREELMVWDGTNTRSLTPIDHSDQFPHWSPDGWLAWSARTESGQQHIYLWDGQNISDISPDADYSSAPFWVPDGRLAWQSGGYSAQELKFWDRGRIGTITAGTGPIRDVRVFLAGLVWTQEIDGNSDVFLWDTTQTINVSDDPAWDGFTLIPPMG